MYVCVYAWMCLHVALHILQYGVRIDHTRHSSNHISLRARVRLRYDSLHHAAHAPPLEGNDRPATHALSEGGGGLDEYLEGGGIKEDMTGHDMTGHDVA